MPDHLTINGLDVGVERKAIKHLHLSVYPPDGRVHVSAPLGTSDERVRMYVLEKWVWLTEKRSAVQDFKRQQAREYVSGEAHYFQGGLYRLKVVEAADARPGVSVNGDYLDLYVRKGATADRRAEIMADWYRSELEPAIAKYVAKWEDRLDVKLSSWEIRQMSAKWGTCSKSKAKAIFNLDLAKKPLVCVEYVVAHELAHLIERTHNADFVKILDSHFHNWREIKRQLNHFPV